jgi:outer membrane protein TolC
VISQRIVTSGKLRLSRDKYKAYTSAAKLQAQSQTLRVHNDVRIHYYRVLGAERRLNMQKELLKTAQDHLVTVLESFNVGQANTADIHAAHVALQQQRLDVEMAENDMQAEGETLTAIIGINSAYKPLAGGLEGKTAKIDRQAALARLLAKSPELAHERAKLRADKFTVKREEVEYIPDVNLRAGAGSDDQTGEPVFRAGASVEVPVFDRNQGAIQQAKADLQRQRGQVRLVELQLRRMKAAQYMLYRTARQHVEDFHNVILPESQQRYRARLHSYHEDRETWENVLDAQHDYFALRMAYTGWLVKWRTAQTAIQGLLLVKGLKAPQDITPPGHIRIQRFEDH